MLWRDETQEGIDGRNPRVPVTARTRRGNKALKATRSSAPTSGMVRRGRQRHEGTGSERGTDRDEGNTLKGEAHGRSDALDASGGRVVDIAKGVTKPRTRYAAAKGFAVGKRVRPTGTCRRAEGVQERKRRPVRRATGRNGAGSR